MKKIKIKSNQVNENKKKESVPEVSLPGPMEHFAKHGRFFFPGFEKRPSVQLVINITISYLFERIVIDILLVVYFLH
jgi:hypothetical protein